MKQPERMRRYRMVALRFAASPGGPSRRSKQVVDPNLGAANRKALRTLNSADPPVAHCLSTRRARTNA